MKLLSILITLATALCLHANPGIYDMPAKQGESSRTAYLAYIKPDSLEAIKKTLAPNEAQTKALAKHGITNVSFWIDKIGDKNVVLCYHRIADKHPDKAWTAAMADPELTKWMEASYQHLIVEKDKPAWNRLETLILITRKEAINDEKGAPKPIISRHVAATILKPEKEMDYRLLHQNPWQGIAETMGACDIPIFDIFLTEIDGKLIEFFYFDYVGNDLDAAFKKMAADPITQRWWKHTDPCQSPLPGASKGNNWRNSTQIK